MANINEFMPHGFCIAWDPTLLAMHVISDVFIALAYFSIPIAIIYYVRKKPEVSFRPVYYLFAAFILACGVTHVMGVATLWVPLYYLEGYTKIVTAVVSMATAIYLVPKLSQIVSLPDLQELSRINDQLKAEIQIRELAEKKLEYKQGELAASNRMLSAVLDAMPSRIYWKDNYGVYQGGNPAFLKDAGLDSAEQLAGKTDADLPWGPEHVGTIRQEDRRVVAHSERIINLERSYTAQGDTQRWLSVSKVPLKDDNGKVVGILGTFDDITDRKAMEASLVLAKEQAIQSQKTQADFLANMSHEIRTPMNGVIGMLNLLLDSELNDTQYSMATASKQSAESLLHILNDILDITKIESGKMVLNESQVQLSALLAEVGFSLALEAEKKGVELICPAQYVDRSVYYADVTRLKQVFINLIGNAIKFTHKGNITVTAQALRDDGDYRVMLFKVKDTGIGIGPEHLTVIFERFKQVDSSATRIAKGTGLGLSIVKELIHLMHGEITVNSEEGVGTEFIFTVRLRKSVSANIEERLQDSVNQRTLSIGLCMGSFALSDYLESVFTAWGQPTKALPAIDTWLNQPNYTGPMDLLFLDSKLVESKPEFDAKLMEWRTKHKARIILVLAQSEQNNSGVVNRDWVDLTLIKPLSQAALFDAIPCVLGMQPAWKYKDKSRHATATSRRFKGRVLVVDDAPMNQMVVASLLRKTGANVTVAGNGKDAIDLLRLQEFDMVLMDCQMPIMDGYEACRQIRLGGIQGVNKDVPVIALTAHAMRDDEGRCLEAGMNDFLTKPLDVDRLYDLASRYLKEHSVGTTNLKPAIQPNNTNLDA